jgi:hypothetical protein
MKYEVKKYYSSFVTFGLEAITEEGAYNKSQNLEVDFIELQNNLQNWKEADEVVQLESE